MPSVSENKDFILVADVDDTLTPNRGHPEHIRREGFANLGRLAQALRAARHLKGFGLATGNSLSSLAAYDRIPEFAALAASTTFKITSVGTAVHHRLQDGTFARDMAWPPSTEDWQPAKIRAAMQTRPELRLQPKAVQSDHKLSYFVTGISDTEHTAYVAELESILAEEEVVAQTLFSSGEYLDFLPYGVQKGSAIRHARATITAATGASPLYIATENSMNGYDFLAAADWAIIPANADQSLKDRVKADIPYKTYFAEENHAGGVLEGLRYAGHIGLIDFPG